jgi:pyridoxine 4-dehydrogenase
MSGVAGMAALATARAAPAGASAAAAGTVRIGGDLVVNRLGFGAMRITGPGIWGEPQDPAAAREVLRRALELGVNFIDTADAYGPDVSERLIAAALYPYPRGLVIATKGGMVRPGPSQWVADGRPEHLREACEGSLRRLQLERIDLYQLHRVDPHVPLEDSIGELLRLQQAGKIRHIGVSNFSTAELARARRVAPIVSVQNRYNVEDRSSEDVLETCTRTGLVFIPWAPLGRAAEPHGAGLVHGAIAWLRDKWRLESDAGSGALARVAAAHDASVAEVAIAWLLARSPAMLPIPGTSSVAHLEQNVAAAGIHLSANQLAALG